MEGGEGTNWTLMECSVEQKISGACIAFENRFACDVKDDL